jgi:hypothetical protein
VFRGCPGAIIIRRRKGSLSRLKATGILKYNICGCGERSPVVKAPGCGPGDRGFKSHRSPHLSFLRPWLSGQEHRSSDPRLDALRSHLSYRIEPLDRSLRTYFIGRVSTGDDSSQMMQRQFPGCDSRLVRSPIRRAHLLLYIVNYVPRTITVWLWSSASSRPLKPDAAELTINGESTAFEFCWGICL